MDVNTRTGTVTLHKKEMDCLGAAQNIANAVEMNAQGELHSVAAAAREAIVNLTKALVASKLVVKETPKEVPVQKNLEG